MLVKRAHGMGCRQKRVENCWTQKKDDCRNDYLGIRSHFSALSSLRDVWWLQILVSLLVVSFLLRLFFQQHTSLSIRQSIITHDFTLMRQITSNSACYLQGSGNWGCFYARGPDFGHSIFSSICYYTLFFIALFLLSLFLSYFCFKHYVSAVFFLLGETPLLFHCSFSLSPMIFGIRTEKIALFLFFPL